MDRQKQILANKYSTELIQFLLKHPKGYSSDDMLYVVRTWAKLAVNIEKGGDPRRDGAAYWHWMKTNVLVDSRITPDMPMIRGSLDDDPRVKPSEAFHRALNDLANQIYGTNDIVRGYAFNAAEGAFGRMLYGFRLKLVQSDPAAEQAFRRSLQQIRHLPAP